MTIPNKSPFLSFYSPRRDSRYKRGRPNFLPFQWGIFALILEAWIKGYVKSSFLLLCTHSHTTMPTTYYTLTSMNSPFPTCASAPKCTSNFTFPYTFVFLIPIYKFPKCMCNVAHPRFIRPTRFSHRSKKSSRQR